MFKAASSSIGPWATPFAPGLVIWLASMAATAVLLQGAVRPASRLDAALSEARRGNYEIGIDALEARVKAQPDRGQARLELGRLLLLVGRQEEALAHFSRIVQDYNERGPRDSESLTWAGAAGAYTGSAQQSIRILEMAQQADPSNSRAFLESGRLFASKYQTGDADRDLQRALALAPGDPEIVLWLARVRFAQYRFDEMQHLVNEVLAKHPERYEARLLKARVSLLQDEDLSSSRQDLNRSLAVNPRDPETLSLLAALEYLEAPPLEAASSAGKAIPAPPRSFEIAASRALAVNPIHAAAYAETAEVLTRTRRHAESERLFRRALKVDADHVPSLTGLGRLMLRDARESEGRDLLERASKLDPYQVPTINQLKILDYMDEEFVYAARGQTLFRVHPWRNPDVLDRLPDHAAQSRLSLASAPGFSGPGQKQPGVLTLEVFPEHRWFEARLSGVPWNGPVGACLGRLIVLDSPATVRSTNWRKIVQHELAHAYHLAAASGRLPNWFTEGLASFQEGSTRPLSWDSLLVRAVALNQLLPFERLNEGFLSPRNAADWQLAYCQSELAIEYLVQTHGPGAPAQLLQAYARGLRGARAIQEALGVDASRLAAAVTRYWRREASRIPLPPASLPDDVPLLKAKYARSGSVEDGLALAQCQMQLGLMAEARRLLQHLVTSNPESPRGQALAGELLLSRGRVASAISRLERALRLSPEDHQTRVALARALIRKGDDGRALSLLRSTLESYDRDPAVQDLILEIGRKRRDRSLMTEALEARVSIDPGDLRGRIGLARIAIEDGHVQKALEQLELGAEIDSGDPELCRLMGKLKAERGDLDGSRRAYQHELASKYLASFDRTPPSTTVQKLSRIAGQSGDSRSEAAVDLLGRVGGASSAALLSGHLKSPFETIRHRAAMALGALGEPTSVPQLIAAIDCSRCAAEARRTLGSLTARDSTGEPDSWRRWWSQERTRGPRKWLLAALRQARYPVDRATDKPTWQALLVVALEDSRWYIREGALGELKRETGVSFGAGAFGPEGDDGPALEQARREALGRWKRWLRTKM